MPISASILNSSRENPFGDAINKTKTSEKEVKKHG